jgi:hypothetical protein
MSYKPIPLKEMIAREPKAIQDSVHAQSKELIKEIAKQQVRDAVREAKRAGEVVERAPISAQAADSHLSSMLPILEKRISKIGGKLRLAVVFPDGPTVHMTLRGRIISANWPGGAGE